MAIEAIKQNPNKRWKKRLLISTPTLGNIRFEWHHARGGQVIPVNWESTGFDVCYSSKQEIIPFDPVGYSIDDAYNLMAKRALEIGVEWVIIIEDDVIIPFNTFVKFAEYMDKGEIPIVSGLYYLKGNPTQPLIFRGRGNGSYSDFKIGKKVWVDGLPMGCLLLHASIIKWFWENSPEYRICDGTKARKVWETPRKVMIDPQSFNLYTQMGTQDLYFFDRIIDEKVLQKTGWPKTGKRKYPFLCDTSIACGHIDRNTGKVYP